MKRIAAVLFAFAMFGSVASAATLTKGKPYKTAKAAAAGGAAYTLSKAAGAPRYASSLKVGTRLGTEGNRIKFPVRTIAKDADGNPLKKLVVTVKKEGPGQYRAYIPNRHVYTPPSTGN